MMGSFSRRIEINCVGNLRDLGGYRDLLGRRTAWRRLFRSGELRLNSPDDVALLQESTGVAAVLDLRSEMEIKTPAVNLLKAAGINYFNLPLVSDGIGPGAGSRQILDRFHNMGECYLYQMRQEMFAHSMITALEYIIRNAPAPLIFHCTIGKDRTGMLSAVLLGVLGIPNADIIADYTLTAPFMSWFKQNLAARPEGVRVIQNSPSYIFDAEAESMNLLLSEIQREYGSFRAYLLKFGASLSLLDQLEKFLLEPDR